MVRSRFRRRRDADSKLHLNGDPPFLWTGSSLIMSEFKFPVAGVVKKLKVGVSSVVIVFSSRLKVTNLKIAL
ncbi:hypothetical protein AVEN_225518-1, partial [Araneus ventricosus]